ncbi:hypothetical protein N7455_009170 [Penicillium solitum]|uniref:uncharacterized protein n=1 Tax=Penicillium rubens TaxID=1108849 RepID=UPI001DD87ADB|nr:uncharacterized protein N7525_004623 [Penicillium rubens]KAI2716308.1 hypothetical protein CBS147318_5422 [Penicillium roqueforti]KAJ5855222.1 hypothetical protein N7455_009170 [Penicillium solitum]KAF3029187.1 hypothetical protein E8E15_001751 [Penicillium rubens]KAI2740576.1 hypothetical protein DTO013F2_9047 [Penicillium roqueforti]KAI3162546.1 hypothetical protein DTO039G3_7929 [Penicillium roqueforti]
MSMKATEQHLPADDSSSIYSRSTECPKNLLPWNSMPTMLPIRHDLPEINSLDHQIALAKGSTMALETTRTRLKCSKSRNRLSLLELRNERICQRDLQEDENEFYRSCFQNLVFLSMVMTEVSQDLTLQYHFEPEAKPLGNKRVLQAVSKLRVATEQSRIREAQAEQVWKRQLKVPRFNPTTRWI